MKEKDRKRFLSKFKQGQPDECWEWEASCNRRAGYGLFFLEGKLVSAHRLSYELFKGEIPDGLCVCHSCDNRLCVNPTHLWVGTVKENNQDCVKKGRWPDRRGKTLGENHGRAKLKENQVREIRSSNLPYRELAKIYGVALSQICRVKLGQRWKHLK